MPLVLFLNEQIGVNAPMIFIKIDQKGPDYLLGDVVTDQLANLVLAQLLFRSENPDKDIYLYINSPGVRLLL